MTFFQWVTPLLDYYKCGREIFTDGWNSWRPFYEEMVESGVVE